MGLSLLRIAARVAASSGDACVYVDLDETLVHSVDLSDPGQKAKFDDWQGEKVELSGGMGTILRSGAREFLDSLRGYGPVYLLTHGVSSYANEIVQKLGLDVDAVFPRESLSGHVGNGEKRFVLIDDMHTSEPILRQKLKAAGAEEWEPPPEDPEAPQFNKQRRLNDARDEWNRRYHLHVPGFVGRGGRWDSGFGNAASKVGEMLEAQKQAQAA